MLKIFQKKEYCFTHESDYFTVKDCESIYLQFSEKTSQLLGWKNKEEGLGKTDYDLPCAAAGLASQYVLQDKKVILSQKELITLDIQQIEILLTDLAYKAKTATKKHLPIRSQWTQLITKPMTLDNMSDMLRFVERYPLTALPMHWESRDGEKHVLLEAIAEDHFGLAYSIFLRSVKSDRTGLLKLLEQARQPDIKARYNPSFIENLNRFLERTEIKPHWTKNSERETTALVFRR